MQKKVTINGEEVEYFNIQQKMDGTMEITFSKEFNIVTAHMGDIMRRLRENHLECQIFKDFKHKIIIIFLKNINDIHSILHTLKIPAGSYETNYEDKLVTIDIPKLENKALIETTITNGVECV